MESLKKNSGEQNKTYSKIKFQQAYTVIMEDNTLNSILEGYIWMFLVVLSNYNFVWLLIKLIWTYSKEKPNSFKHWRRKRRGLGFHERAKDWKVYGGFVKTEKTTSLHFS